MDIARGLGIILVVYGHVLRGLNSAGLLPATHPLWLSDYVIYTFHMPLFFVLSGMNVEHSLRKGRAAFLRSKLITIAYPYALWSVLEGLLQLRFASHVNSHPTVGTLESIGWRPMGIFWFLYVLFMLQLVGMVLARRPRTLAVVALGSYAGSFFMPANIWARVAEMLLFFAAGILFSRQIRTVVEKASVRRMALSAVVFGMLAWAGGWLSHQNYDSPLSLPATVSGMAMVCFAAEVIAKRTRSAAGVLGSLGVASMAIYVLHVTVAAGLRALLESRGIRAVPVHVVLETILGLVVPWGIYLACSRARAAKALGLGPNLQQKPLRRAA